GNANVFIDMDVSELKRLNKVTHCDPA
ncbi:MAG: hypothetical protein ACI9QN_000263, partial [Arcticibacterium sp.]